MIKISLNNENIFSGIKLIFINLIVRNYKTPVDLSVRSIVTLNLHFLLNFFIQTTMIFLFDFIC
jgi:hypothetical protein